MSIDPRIERNTRSVFALRDLLREIIQNPCSFADNEILIKALESQGAISKLSDTGRGILASSLNTVKRVSNHVLEGGFDALDSLRTAASDSIDEHKAKMQQSPKTTKASLQIELQENKKTLQQILEDLFLVTAALDKSMKQSRSYAKRAASPAVLALCEREQRDLLASLSMCKTPTTYKRRSS